VLRLDIMSSGLHPIVIRSSTLRFISSGDGINLSPCHPGCKGMYHPNFLEFAALVPLTQHFLK
jgi:hypothetical protein